ncbi:tRNA-i(6)A37 methylthiotransferase [Chitinispirillum alkaliphilum]|nr:tRNA-i(6)A37 methylthiotransferase [Chitinispirillum alkaliphilum]
MNVADSDIIFQILSDRGFVSAKNSSEADLLVVNTCSVRENAELRARSRIQEYARTSKNPSQKLWVIGCMAERLGDKLIDEIPGIDHVIGAKDMEDIRQRIDEILPDQTLCGVINTSSSVTDFVPVMRGCDNYCSYCIVPYVRGHEISIPVEEVEKQVKKKIDQGVKEITLLGQNVNSYRYENFDFPDLISKISEIEGLERLRFTTSHPRDCSEKLISTVAQLQNVCNHIHLPVQAGSDRVLSLMNRGYTGKDYRKLVDMIRKHIPDADITTDILVGFPSETQEEFKQTLSLVEDVAFTTAFMFAYSPREGTKAASMKECLSDEEKKARLTELITMQTEITRKAYGEMVGKEIEVLVSGRQEKHDKMWMGQDYGCKRVLLSCTNAQAGMILKAKVVRSSGMTLIAERI